MEKRLSRTITTFLAALLLPMTAIAAETSFDCSKASNMTEKIICQDATLTQLDRKMGQTYAAAKQGYLKNEMQSLKSSQRTWIKRRNLCKTDKKCIVKVYQERIARLQIEGGLLHNTNTEEVPYHCSNGREMKVVYYNDTEIPAVYINTGKFQKILFRTNSGSGAQYRSGSDMFWEHHGEATLKTAHSEVQCREKQ